MLKDWKFALMLAVTIAGVVVPIWLWRSDLSSKSLSVRFVSQTALQLAGAEGLSGVEVTVNGKKLKSPFLTIVEVVNDGSRPVVSGDWETPLELVIKNSEVQVERIELGRRSTESIDPKLLASKNKVTVAPLLLNPSDRFEVAIVTSEGEPDISPRVRIAGVSDVRLVHSDDTPSTLRPWGRLAIAWLACALMAPAISMLLFKWQVPPNRLFAGALLIVAGSIFFNSLYGTLRELGLRGPWHFTAYAFAYFSAFIPARILWVRRQ